MVKGKGNTGGSFCVPVRLGVLALVVVVGWALLHGTPVAQAQAVPNDQTAVEPVTFAGCDNEQVTMKRREYEVFRAHNAYRADKGLRAFCVDATLQRVAQAHSTDMATRNFYSHTNPDGKGPGHRLGAAGYSCYPYGGENIGVEYPENTSAEVTQSWIDSAGHRANIVDARHVRIGIASANDADFGEWYYGEPDYGEYVNYTVNFAGNDCPNMSGPSIAKMLPARGQAVSDTTPAISAVVSDPETEVTKGNVAVYMDGKKLSGTRYAYDPNTDRLSGTSTRLSKGASHTFKIVASDGDGQKTTRSTKFSVRG